MKEFRGPVVVTERRNLYPPILTNTQNFVNIVVYRYLSRYPILKLFLPVGTTTDDRVTMTNQQTNQKLASPCGEMWDSNFSISVIPRVQHL